MAQAALTVVVLALVALAQAGAPPQAVPAQAVPQDSLCAAVPKAALTGAPAEQTAVLRFTVGGHAVSVCYSRPVASQAEPSLGTAIPYGVIWHTGGSTPAVLTTAGRISIAGLAVPPGRYVLYTVPGHGRWQIVINRSVAGWTDGPGYGPAQQATEVGRVAMPVERAGQFVPQLTLHTVAAGPNAVLLLDWQSVRLTIPIMPG